MVGVRSPADGTETVERGYADRRGEVPVATATHRVALDPGGDRVSEGHEGGRRRFGHGGAIDRTRHLDHRVGVEGMQRCHRCLDAIPFLARFDTHVDLDAAMGRHHVVGRTDDGDGRGDRGADLETPELVDRQDLMGHLDEGVDPLLRFEPGVRCPAVNDDIERAASLPPGLQGAAVG